MKGDLHAGDSRVDARRHGLARIRTRLIDRLVRYFREPSTQFIAATRADGESLAPLLHRGDVLLSEGSTRLAILVKRITRSHWSHVSMYVGPLDDGADPRCVVEADIAGGVRSIRLSELDALRVRVLRPMTLSDIERSRVADWVVAQIGCEYDFAQAWAVGKDLLHLRWRIPPRASCGNAGSPKRFICCSLLAHAFALIGYPIAPPPTRAGVPAVAGNGSLTPDDFQHAVIFELLHSKSA